MRDNFSSHYTPDDSAFERLWALGLIALDANVLLNLYRYPATARDELLLTLERYKDRLFVPHQVAVEYHRGRLGVIAFQRKRAHEVKEVLRNAETRLREDLRKLQLERRHSSISIQPFLQRIESEFAAFKELIQQGESGHPQVVGCDLIRDRLDTILDSRIGTPFSQSELDKVYIEGKQRYNDNRPPGYGDSSKGRSEQSVYYASNLRIERQFGDLIVWKQIVKAAAERKATYVMFVTDDEKDDWWEIVDSGGPKVIGARRELKEEIASEAGVVLFHLYSSERFLEHASRREKTASPEAIEQIGDVKRADQEDRLAIANRRAEPLILHAVARWLGDAYGPSVVHRGEFPDLVVRSSAGILGYEVRSFSHNISRIRSVAKRLQDRAADFLRLYFVLVTLDVTRVSHSLAACEDFLTLRGFGFLPVM